MTGEDQPTFYSVNIGDIAESQIAQATFGAIGRLGSERGQQWSVALSNAVESLSLFPHRNQVDLIDGPSFSGREVRCELFRYRSVVWRLLYYIIEPGEGESEGQVWILRFRYAASRPLAQYNEGDE